MRIRFAKDFISFSFENDETFPGRTLDADGEATSKVFYADAATLKWRPPYSEEKLCEEDIRAFREKVKRRNAEHDYKIMFVEEMRNDNA